MTRADQAGLVVQDIARSSVKQLVHWGTLDAKTRTVRRRSQGARNAATARRSKPSNGKPR